MICDLDFVETVIEFRLRPGDRRERQVSNTINLDLVRCSDATKTFAFINTKFIRTS